MKRYFSDNEITRRKSIFKYWYDLGYPGGDVYMIEVCRLLNSIPGIATVYCCESHPPTRCRAYIMFEVTESGYRELIELFSRIREHFISSEGFYPTFWRVSLSTSTRVRAQDRHNRVILPSFILEAFNYSKQQKLVFIGILLNSINDYLNSTKLHKGYHGIQTT